MAIIQAPYDDEFEDCPWCSTHVALKLKNIEYAEKRTNFELGQCQKCKEFVIRFVDYRKYQEGSNKYNDLKEDYYILPNFPNDIPNARGNPPLK